MFTANRVLQFLRKKTKKKDELHAIEKAVQKRWDDEKMFEVDAPKVFAFEILLDHAGGRPATVSVGVCGVCDALQGEVLCDLSVSVHEWASSSGPLVHHHEGKPPLISCVSWHALVYWGG